MNRIHCFLFLLFVAFSFVNAQVIVDKNKGNSYLRKEGLMDGNLVSTVYYNYGEIADWQNDATLELLADCNAQPPLGLGGVEATDKAKERHGKIVIGALGLGGLKLKLHRECIGKLFEAADQVFDCENIYAQAKALA